MELNWLFVNDVPILVSSRNLARQQKVEAWLDLAELLKELGIEAVSVLPQTKPELTYIS